MKKYVFTLITILLFFPLMVNAANVKITFNPISGKVSPTSTSVKKGSTYGTLPKPTRRGYDFTGWYKAKSGGTKVASTSKVDKARTLYARWGRHKYKITYVLNSGTNNKYNPSAYRVTDKVALKTPTRRGCVFKGWYKDSKFTKKVTGIKKGTVGNKTFYAKWSSNTYSITYVKNGGTGKMTKSTNLRYFSSYHLKANTYTRRGFRFYGWNTKSDGSGTWYKNKDVIKGLVLKNKGNINLYARWVRVYYKISYELNYGMNDPKNTFRYRITDTVTFTNPTKTGYTFKGWFTDSGFKNRIKYIPKNSVGNKKIYAKWSKTNYVSNLHNKKAIFFGDSITFGYGGTPRGYGWPNYIGKYFDIAKSTNSGKPGWLISNKIEGRWLNDLILQCEDAKYDYVILHGGTNDIHRKVTLGTYDESDFSGEYNVKTFLGGLETYIYNAKKKFPNSKIGFIINYETPNASENRIKLSATYYTEMKKVLDKWNVPYLDLFFGTAPNGYKYGKLLKVTTNEYLPDDLHLNSAGYKVISPYIYQWMNQL